MKTKATIIGLVVFTGIFMAAGLIVTHHRPRATPASSQRTFQAKGVVRGLPDAKTVLIEHEDIPDFMPAMTMPFTVKDGALLNGLKLGDRVAFELVVTKDDSWISRIKSERHPGQALQNSPIPSSVGSAGSQELETRQRVPEFTLTNQNGQAFHLSDFKGKAVLLTFVYTRCPLPNYCPLMSKNFASLQQRLQKQFPGRFHLLSISFDPQHDSPEVLKRYAQLFTKDESTWSFATGAPSEIQRLGTEFGLVYLPEAGSFTHDLRSALIAPDGKLVHIWRSNVWTPYELQRWVAEVLGTTASPSTLISSAAGSKPGVHTQQIRD